MTVFNGLLNFVSDGLLDIGIGGRVRFGLLDLAIAVVQKSAHFAILPSLGV
jgi:hypothetical protein